MKASLVYFSSQVSQSPSATNSPYTNNAHQGINLNAPTLTQGSKVKHVEAHPSLPWAASIEEDGRVVVLDYIRNETLASFTADDLQQWVILESPYQEQRRERFRNGSYFHGRTPRSTNKPHTPLSRGGLSLDTATTESLTVSSMADASTRSQESFDQNSSLGLKTNVNSNNLYSYQTSLSRLTPLSGRNITSLSSTQPQPQPQRILNQNESSMRIGSIRQVRFFDRHTLFWDTNSRNSHQQNYNYSRIPHNLIIQCDHRTILVNLKYNSKMNARSIQSIIATNSHKYPITCMAEPISPTILVYGSTYGTICFYDIEQRKIVKTMKLHKKVDSVTQLLIVNGGLTRPSISKNPTTRFVALCSSGIAYLVEVELIYDDDGYEISLAPILGRIDGLLNSIENNTGVTTGKSVGCFSYDADRDFLIGVLAGGKTSGVWDLSTVTASIAHSNKSIPLLKPFLALKLIGSDSGSGSSLLVVPAMQYPSFPDSVLACWMGNKSTGDIYVLLSSLSRRETMVTKPNLHFSFSLSSFKDHLPSKMRIYSMAIPRLRNHNIICGTNVGMVVLSIEDEAASKFLCGARHASLNEDSTSGGILLIEGSSLFATTPHSTIPNPSGQINLRNPVLIYKSPDLLSDFSQTENQIRLPPRLLISPSREFLCLFWHVEMRYEILHMPSLLKIQKDSGQYPPPVEFGLDVVSFAWVGNNDAFAILHSMVASENLKKKSSPGLVTKQSFSLKRELKSKISRKTIIDAIPVGNRRNNESSNLSSHNESDDKKRGTVELKILISINNVDLENVGSSAAAITSSLGQILIRGGGRPTALFGGPVLCIGSSKKNRNSDGSDNVSEAYFYSTSRSASTSETKINGTSNVKASSFTTVGPSLTYPDLVVWSDDCKFCCLCVGSRVSIYFSKPPEFTLVGTTLLAPNEIDPKIESAKFINNVLYCTSRATVQCIFFGPIDSSDDMVTDLESFILASSDTPLFSREFNEKNNASTLSSFSPQAHPMTFGGGPSILMYFAGSLLVSTPSGIKGVNLSHPLLRIGILIAAGHLSRAQRWFKAVEPKHHESLARFLERRKTPELATFLSGLSLESMIDLCIKYTFTSKLESLIEEYGIASIRQIDVANGGFDDGHSTVECVGAFLLGQGKAELVRRIASECIVSGEEARKEAFFLATLLISVDPGDAKRLVKRAVGVVRGKKVGSDSMSASWPVGSYVRDHIL